jgi:hypothetical protein
MPKHPCPHCCRGWPDRHPAAAVTAGLFTLTLTAMMLSVHPVAAAVMVALAGTGGLAYLVDRERGRRAALAARAEHDYRAVLAAPVPPARPTPWRVLASLPTTPLGLGRN